MPTVTSKGQVTLPKEIRDALGLRPGSKIEFSIESGRVILRKCVSEEPYLKWEGFLRGKLPADSVDEYVSMLRGSHPTPDECDEDRG